MGQGLENVLHVLMGRDCLEMVDAKLQKLHQDIETTRTLTPITGFDGHTGKGVAGAY